MAMEKGYSLNLKALWIYYSPALAKELHQSPPNLDMLSTGICSSQGEETG